MHNVNELLISYSDYEVESVVYSISIIGWLNNIKSKHTVFKNNLSVKLCDAVTDRDSL